ncbi:MAG TPA: NUDIX hydrolase [Candidatus Saccharimonadales bacterium]|nr:NUDIX hydrolase [Candidatus Saccharimonadales bacterium]
MGNWQTRGSRIVHQNPFYIVREDDVLRPNGKPGKYFVAEVQRAVFLVPVDNNGNILCIKLFRYPTQMESWEVPAGSIEDGETPLQAAKRELQEETGLTATKWEHIGEMQTSNSRTNGLGDVFVCSGLRQTKQDERAEEGITRVTPFSPAEVLAMIRRGDITDAVSLAPLMMAFAAQKLTTQL